MLARVIGIVSVCPSVTRRYCVKTKKASFMISSVPGSPKTLVFWCQIAKGGLGKFSDFLALNVNISKTAADRAKSVTIND